MPASTRLYWLCGKWETAILVQFPFPALVASIKQVGGFCAFGALRILLNLWTTKARFQADSLAHCVFGCRSGRDNLGHYFVCPILCSIIASLGQFPAPLTVNDQILLLCGIKHPLNPSPNKRVFWMALIIHLYNNARADLCNIHQRGFSVACNYASDVCSAFNVSAGRPLVLFRIDQEIFQTFLYDLLIHRSKDTCF